MSTEKQILITVRDDDFDVKCDSTFTVEELYVVLVSFMQHLEDEVESYTSHSAPLVLQ